MHGNVAIFSHGQFSCVLAARWIGLPIMEARHFLLDPASFSVLGHSHDHPDTAVIALWNSVPAAPGGQRNVLRTV
jgi:probable phosphoglycerate mutase